MQTPPDVKHSQFNLTRALFAVVLLPLGCVPRAATAHCPIIDRPPPPVRPTPDELVEARQRFYQGIHYVSLRRWGEALEAFRGAQRLADHPVTSFNVAQTLWALHRYDEVVDELTHFNIIYDIVRDHTLHERALALMERARARLGILTLTLSPEDAAVSIDGVDRHHRTEGPHRFTLVAGHHVVEVHALARPVARLTVRVRPYESVSRTVTLGAFARH